MKIKSTPFLLTLILMAAGFFTGCSPVEDELYVSRYKGVFTSVPQKVPTLFTPDGPIAGNGDIGIVYGGSPDKQLIYFSKNDFWKAKLGYGDGGLCLPGGLNITVDELKDASYHAEQQIDHGIIEASFKRGDLTYKLKTWVPATENLVVIELSAEGASCRVNLDLWAKEGNESRVESGTDHGIVWFTRHFDSPELVWPSHIAVAMRIVGANSSTFILKPSAPVRILVSLGTNHERDDYFETAVAKVREISGAGLSDLRKEHNRWWNEFWSASKVEIGDTLIEKYYYGAHYLLASCSRNMDFPPGLWGNSITDDTGFSNWAGDYHLNYNFQAPWWGVYSSNHVELSDPYDAPILAYMEQGKQHAKELLNCDGVYYPVGIGPKGFCTSMFPLTAEKMLKSYRTEETGIEGGYMFLGQKSNAVFAAANMFMRFYHTYDTAYSEKVYPFIREVADFWEDYLKFENGRYMSYDDSFWEVGPWMGKDWKKDYGDINPTVTLGMLRMLFRDIMEMSSFLGVDEDRHAKWQYILDHLSPIPTIEIDGAIRIKACEGGTGSGSRTKPGFGRVTMHGLTFPTGVAGTLTDPQFAEILRKEIGRWGIEPMGDANWNSLQGSETYYTSAVRVGFDPDTILTRLKRAILTTKTANLFIPHGGGGIEMLSPVTSSINEMLLQGYEGVMRVFPNWPVTRDAKFENLRTYGAFLVSSEIKNSSVEFIRITSEKGRECKLLNPWSNRAILIEKAAESGMVPFEQTGSTILFNTEPGKTYLIKPV
jgi:alpha-L-fucosidase 2